MHSCNPKVFLTCPPPSFTTFGRASCRMSPPWYFSFPFCGRALYSMKFCSPPLLSPFHLMSWMALPIPSLHCTYFFSTPHLQITFTSHNIYWPIRMLGRSHIPPPLAFDFLLSSGPGPPPLSCLDYGLYVWASSSGPPPLIPLFFSFAPLFPSPLYCPSSRSPAMPSLEDCLNPSPFLFSICFSLPPGGRL